ncbi:MAG: transglutaminase domain-containing protein [Gemmobacter sp.]
MRIAVDHVTTWRYATPVRGVVQSHRLRPAEHQGQRIVDWGVTVTDGLPGGAFRDGAGDWVQGWTVRGPVEAITVRVTGTVETADTAGVLRGHRETVPPEAWLRETAATRADAAIRTLAEAEAADPLDLAHALSAAVADAVDWTPGSTTAQTTAAEALAAGKGVCQDHAHVLIAAARLRGRPARYVSGYLLTEDKAADAGHAWAEIHVPGLGWVGFDPTNRCCPDARYVRLASGFDAADAAPVRGMARGTQAEALDVAVAVRAVQQ